jgi:hypothetical protein
MDNTQKAGTGSKLKKILKLPLRFFSLRTSRKIFVVLAVMIIGTIALVLSHAATPYDTTTNPNTVILSYTTPDATSVPNKSNLMPADTASFTLYGNGLLVCGHTPSPYSLLNDTVFKLPTYSILSASQIQSLIQQVYNTGFPSLNTEYFKLPIAEHQSIVRLNLLSGEKRVFFYNDVPAPAAYTQTLSILRTQCQSATQAYLPTSINLRVKKFASPQAGYKYVSLSSLDGSIRSSVQSAIYGADNIASRSSASAPTTASSTNEYDQLVSGTTALYFVYWFYPQGTVFVSANGATYQVMVDEKLPVINNPLQVNYTALRSSNTALGRSATFVKPTNATIPVRVVLLLPSDGGSAEKVSQATSVSSQVYNWFCGQINQCYATQPVTVMRGTQTAGYYMTCHETSGVCNGDPLLSLVYNVAEKDVGTIYRSDIDTVIVPGWSTGEINVGACGWGMIGTTLAAVDLYEPNITNAPAGSGFCQPGHDMAHELGHTFGLSHTGNGTLMDGSPYAIYASFCDIGTSSEPSCRLDGTQVSVLQSTTQYFNRPNLVGWSLDWEPQTGVSAVGSPSVVSWGSGRLDVFIRGSDNQLYHKGYDPTYGWGGWEYQGGVYLSSDPVAVSWSAGRLDVFARSGTHLFHKGYQSGYGWGGWEDQGGSIQGNPSAVSWGPGRLDAFALGTDNAVYHLGYQSGYGWGGWESRGGYLTTDVAVTAWAPGRLDIFARGGGSAQELYHQSYRDYYGWSGWENLGGQVSSNPTAVSWGVNRIDVFVRGGDSSSIYHLGFDGNTWGGWENQGGISSSDQLSATTWGTGRLDVFSRSNDGSMYHKFYQAGVGWSGWENHGPYIISKPAAAAWAPGRLDVFALGGNSQLYHMGYQQ